MRTRFAAVPIELKRIVQCPKAAVVQVRAGVDNDSRIAPFFLDAPAKANLIEFLESLSGEGWQQIKAPERLPQ